MSEASDNYKFSPAAEKLADSNNIDLSLIKGSGNEGLITKADVDRIIAKRKALSASVVMPEATGDETVASGLVDKMNESLHMPTSPEAHPKSDVESIKDNLIAEPTQAELLALLTDMRTELTALKDSQAKLVEREHYSRDLTDDLFFICRPQGMKWQEKRIRNKRTILVDFVSTAFFGPFEDKEKIEEYLTEKRQKREDSYIDWEGITIMTGRDARLLDAQETQERDLLYTDDVSTNVLDRRVFRDETAHDSNIPTGQLIGPAA